MSLESVNTLTNRDIFAVQLAVELHMEHTLISSPGYHRLWLYREYTINTIVEPLSVPT
jgi:hypothetical protein